MRTIVTCTLIAFGAILAFPFSGLMNYFDPVKTRIELETDVPSLDSQPFEQVFYSYWGNVPEDERRDRIAYTNEFREAFLADTTPASIPGKVVVLSLEESAYNRHVRAPGDRQEIELAQLIFLLQADQVMAAKESGIMHKSLASFMADADRQTTNPSRALMYLNDFGAVYCYIRDQNGVLQLVIAHWIFGSGGWLVDIEDSEEMNGSAPGVRYLYPA
jgi:hypothetical protein